MASRYFLAICALVLFAAVVSIHAKSVPESLNEQEYEIDDSFDSSIEDGWLNKKLLKKAVQILEKALKGAAKHCLEPAAKHCKKYWYNPSKLIDCATEYIAVQCIAG